MPLNLNDLMKKAEKKRIVRKNTGFSSEEFLRPWQYESVLFVNDDGTPKANMNKTRDKLKINLGRTGDNTKNKREPNVSQAKAKLEPNVSQTRAKCEPNVSQTRANLKPFVGQNQRHIVSQTRAKRESNNELSTSFSNLVGLQRKLVLFIHETRQTIFNQNTNPLSMECIAEQCKVNKHAARKAIQRLEQKNIIIRTSFKVGRGGWTQYKLTEEIIQEILIFKNQNCEPIVSQTRAKHGTEPETEPETTPFSSSSYINNLNINKTTTTDAQILSNSNAGWNFDINPYSKFGFQETNLKQLISLNVISAQEVEQSLIEFSYDFENNLLPVIKTTKINFLMGLLRSGHSYVSEAFKNDLESSISEMARRADGKRKALLKAKFEAWEDALAENERKEIENNIPMSLLVSYRAYGISDPEVRKWFFDYFLNKQ